MRIQTNYAHHMQPNLRWEALDMNAACKLLHGYDLSTLQKESMALLMMSYYRLIDESGLIGYGPTMKEAIAAAKAKSTTNKSERINFQGKVYARCAGLKYYAIDKTCEFKSVSLVSKSVVARILVKKMHPDCEDITLKQIGLDFNKPLWDCFEYTATEGGFQ